MFRNVSLTLGVVLFMSTSVANASDDLGHEPEPNVIEAIEGYIHDNVESDRFASLHLDREDEFADAAIMLSFTEMISTEQQEDIQALTSEEDEVKFREVAFTEEELLTKQENITMGPPDETGFDFQIVGTSVNIFENQIDVGIDPYTESNRDALYEEYGSEMIYVEPMDTPELDVEETEEPSEEPNFFQRILQSISDWWDGLGG
ncbi:hypothetical protein ACE1TF_04300 [Geomicrobium sp. JSM 1781026]|uniref:hypothetical protein n=1 Tax=Geomicrobium sp. JSM 1781026 TaxID=3344580 RepID=UPI0035C18472